MMIVKFWRKYVDMITDGKTLEKFFDLNTNFISPSQNATKHAHLNYLLPPHVYY